jgi:hypothetical protein
MIILYVLPIYKFLKRDIYLYILETTNRNSRTCQIILMNSEKSKKCLNCFIIFHVHTAERSLTRTQQFLMVHFKYMFSAEINTDCVFLC